MERVIHVFSTGKFERRSNTLYFETEAGEPRYLPVENVREIWIHGEVTFNKRFIEFLADREILLNIFNRYGYFVGTFYPREHYNSGYMIVKQAEHYLDTKKRLQIARAFVSGAATNMLRVLKYYAGRGKDVTKSIASIEALVDHVKSIDVEKGQTSISELMGLEGNIREQYYRAFDAIIQQPAFSYLRRTRRPPSNALNALISFLNSIVYTTVLSEIYKTHLDPRIGYLHTTNFRRFTLNLDVAEIFKPILADRTIFRVLGRKMITAKDFEVNHGGVWLSESARKQLVADFDAKLNTTVMHRPLKRAVSYRRLIRLELYKLEKHLMGEQEYTPFEAMW
ncbi:MAG: type I-B CRISPR-associated endonuclease Cas1b [Firmicutes bacterium]|nr:type I-B CRISPR-associated endonuclease Cas1 [Alicyclobacillaceae bacterium]MCL6498049.1 type I-B CRISPR-associated endonuclease Cas1b [Bacillota bacterium]